MLDEATLILWNDCRQNVFEPIGHDFNDNFIANVVEGDWSKSIEGSVSFFLLG
jgi:hypothetical protein